MAEIFEGLTLLSEGGPEVTKLELHLGPGGSPEVVDVRWVGPMGAEVRGFEISTTVFDGRIGMALIGSENIRVVDCWFVDITSTATAGAGIFQNAGTAEIVDCSFVRCTATLEGGAINVIGSSTGTSTIVRDCVFEECGPTALTASGGGDIEVSSCIFRSNFGFSAAGGLTATGQDLAVISNNRFVDNDGGRGGGLALNVSGFAEVFDNVFLRNSATNTGGALWISSPGAFHRNTFVANDNATSAAVHDRHSGSGVEFRNNILALNSGGTAYHSVTDLESGDCNVFWSNAGGDYSNYAPGPNDLFMDPEFCDVPNDDYTVRSTSPCAEENSPICGQIGAYGIGCGTVSIETSSWGRIKALHHGGE